MAKRVYGESFCVCTKRDLFASFGLIWAIHWTHILPLFMTIQKLPLRRILHISSFIDSLHARSWSTWKLLLVIRHAVSFQRRTLAHIYFLFSQIKLSFFTHTIWFVHFALLALRCITLHFNVPENFNQL